MSLQFADVNGVRLEFEVVGAGPQLIYLHGLSGNLEIDRRLCERLADHFTVMWYSSRGHGRSTAPTDRGGWNYRHFAADLDAMIDVVGFDRPYVVGGSHGANTLLRHAVDFPDRASAGAVIAPGANAIRRPARWRYWGLRTVNGWMMRKGLDGAIELITGMEPGSGDADPVTIAAARTHDFGQLKQALTHVPDQAAVDPDALARVSLPVVVSAWDKDPIIHPITVARQIAERMPAARFEQIARLADQPADEIAERATADVTRWFTELTSVG